MAAVGSRQMRTAITLLKRHGLDVKRIVEQAPRIADVENLAGNLEFWTNTLRLDTIETYPEVLYVRPSVYNEFFNNFVKVFSVTDVSRIMASCPQVVMEEWPDLQKKIDYAIHVIGATHTGIIHSRYLLYPMLHIRTRFEFISRCGVYVKPHRKDKKKRYVIPLSTIVESSLKEFLGKTGLTVDEYAVFKDMIEEEMREEAKYEDDDDDEVD